MGNCVFKGFGEVEDMVKVVTPNGGLMELYAPITAECITNEFPDHRIFRSQDLLSAPLLPKEELHAGELYYLLPVPLNKSSASAANTIMTQQEGEGEENTNASCTRSRRRQLDSQLTTVAAGVPPYRMSFDNHGMLLKRSSEAAAEVFPRYNCTGVWKVRLVINPEQLSEILSQEACTEALIESVRTVAKCGTSTTAAASANSDPWIEHL